MLNFLKKLLMCFEYNTKNEEQVVLTNTNRADPLNRSETSINEDGIAIDYRKRCAEFCDNQKHRNEQLNKPLLFSIDILRKQTGLPVRELVDITVPGLIEPRKQHSKESRDAYRMKHDK